MLTVKLLFECSSPLENAIEHQEQTDVSLPELRQYVQEQQMVIIKAKDDPWIVRQDGCLVVLNDQSCIGFNPLE